MVDVQKPKVKQSPSTLIQDAKLSRRTGRYLIIGTSLTIFNYVVYIIFADLIINDNNLLWLSSLIATALTTILAYILHSRITWKERTPSKAGIYNFIIWNVLLTVIIHPFFTQIFSYLTPLYDFTFSITESIHIPFTYEFIQNTGAFILNTIVVMFLNFLFYDKFVFGQSKSPKSSK